MSRFESGDPAADPVPEAHQLASTFKDPDFGIPERLVPRRELEIEVGSGRVLHVEGARRRSQPDAKPIQLLEVIGGREHVGPPWCVQVLAVHDQHRYKLVVHL